MDVHRVANHQRAAFVAAQHAGRECPGDLQLPDVRRVDLIELGIPRIGVVALLHNPLLRILGQLVQASSARAEKPCRANRPKIEVVAIINLFIRFLPGFFRLEGSGRSLDTTLHGTSFALFG